MAPDALENPEFTNVGAEIDLNAGTDGKRRPLASIRARLGARLSFRDTSGFTLMEAVIAMMLFALLATAMLSVLTAGVSAQSLSRQRTIAEQASTAQVEYIRTLAYSNVGNPGGNPNGTVPLTQSVAAVMGATYPGLTGTVTTKVEWNNNPSDKVATAYRNAAFYKKITITVTRASDGKQLSQVVTYVSDTNGGTGVNEAEIDLNVLDIGNNTPLAGQLVNLTTGPSAPLSDTSDAGGDITFPALTANPTSGPTAYYNLSMTPLSGYTLLKDDDIALTPSSPNAHMQLAPSQTFNSTLRVYQGSTITVNLVNQATSTTYTGNATVTLSTTLRGTATSQNYAYSGGPLPITTFSGEKVIPTPSPIVTGGYTASVSAGFFATSVLKATVPNTYPTDLTSTYTLTGYPTGTLTATVTWAGSPVSGATVTLTGGPTSTNQSASTNGSGVATFTDIPAGSGYTLTAAKGGQTSAGTAATVTAGATTNVGVAMPVGTVAVTVSSAGSPISGATVSISGGNITGSIPVGGVLTNASGQATVANVPAGSGITVSATKGLQNGSTSGVTVSGGATTNVTVAMPLGSIAVTVTWAGNPVANCSNCVTLSGGALGSSVVGSTDASGNVTFINVPATSGYQIDVVKGGQTGTKTSITVTGGSTTNVTVTMPVGSITATVTWNGSPVSGATIQYSGGNVTGTVTAPGTTNSSGVLTIANVPSGAGVTVSATAGGQTGSTGGVTVPNGSAVPVSIAMPVGTIAVNVKWAGLNVANCANCVTVSGGNLTSTLTGSTDASGNVTFANVPAGTGYTVSATKAGQTGSASGVTVTGGSTTTVNLTLPVGSVAVSVTWVGAAVANCSSCVTLSGGNLTASVTGSTDASGNVTFSSVPAGSGYTVTVVKNGQTGTASGLTVTNGATTPAPVTMPTGTISVTVTWASQNINNASISVTGGPSGASYSGTTNASGVATITVPATTASFPYTVTATKNNGTGNVAVSSLASGATASPAIALSPTKSVVITVQQNGAAINNTNVTLSITGGPGGTVGALPAWGGALTTNGTSKITVVLPQGTGAFTYTIRAYRTGCATVRSGVIAGISDNAATTTATVNMATASCPGTTP